MSYKLIPLSQGRFAKVDYSDFEWASQFNWFVWIPSGAPQLIYAVRKVRLPSGNYSKRLLHRELLNAPRGVEVDHWDRDGLNNRRKNLRFCSTSQNQGNSRQHKDAGSSKFKGVTWHKGCQKWQASIQFQKVRKYLGWFDNEDEAGLAYAEASRRLFGEFSRTK